MPGHARTSMTTFWKFNWWGSLTNVSFHLLNELNINTFPITNRSLAFTWIQIFHAFLRMSPWVGKTRQIYLSMTPLGARLKGRGARHLEEGCFSQRRLAVWCPEARVLPGEISMHPFWGFAPGSCSLRPWEIFRVPTWEAALRSAGSYQCHL